MCLKNKEVMCGWSDASKGKRIGVAALKQHVSGL